MKILLINPNVDSIVAPPLGLCSLAAMLKSKGYGDILGIDLNLDSISDFKREIRKADIIGISVVSKVFPDVVELSRELKKINPKVKICLGGPHPSLEPRDCISPKTIDFVIVGHGENSFYQLVEVLDNKKDFSKIKGLCYKKRGKIKISKSCEFVKDLDELPFPIFDSFPLQKYTRMRFFPIAPIISSRSCPNVCTICQPALRKIAGPYRKRSIKHVIDEMKELRKKYNIRLFDFVDNTFTINKNWVMDFCKELKKERMNVKWGCAATIKTIDKEMMKAMKETGCTFLSFGIESGSQRVLDEVIHKGISLEKVKKVMKWASELRLRVHCWFIIGLPGETKEEIMETVELAKNLNANSVMFSVGVPQPYVEITRIGKENNWIIPHTLSDLEKPGFYSYGLFGNLDPYLSRTSLFQTDQWGPDFIELVKFKIIEDFKDWDRSGFGFRNIKKESRYHFIEFFGSELLSFFNDFKLKHIKLMMKAIKYRLSSY